METEGARDPPATSGVSSSTTGFTSEYSDPRRSGPSASSSSRSDKAWPNADRFIARALASFFFRCLYCGLPSNKVTENGRLRWSTPVGRGS